MNRFFKKHTNSGFALPTVLITSVAMIIVLLAALQATVSTTTYLTDSYYQKLAEEAAESGFKYADTCIAENDPAAWTQLRPDTECDGTVAGGVNCAANPVHARCKVYSSPRLRSTFEVGPLVSQQGNVRVNVKGVVSLLRPSGVVYRTFTADRSRLIVQTRDSAKDRAIQRYWYVGDSTMPRPNGGSGSSRLDFGVSGTNNPSVEHVPHSDDVPTFGEGFTVVTNTNGKLLFSTNGIRVWNADNNVMSNVSISALPGGLGATASTAQGAVAFPISGNRYVVVSNSAGGDAYQAGNPGEYGELKKAIVDMNEDHGKGNVVPESIQTLTRGAINSVAGPSNMVLSEPNGTFYYTGQYMTAAPERNGKGYWLVFATPGRQYLYSLLFNNQGELTRVVRSQAPGGALAVCKRDGAWQAHYGMMRFNNAYDKLAMINGAGACSPSAETIPNGYDTVNYRGAGHVYLLRFNNATGEFGTVYSNNLQNQRWYSVISSCVDKVGEYAISTGYSVDFSPDENYVYATSIYPGNIYRFRITGSDIENGSTTIASTAQYMGKSDGTGGTDGTDGGQVRRAPDGRMYIVRQNATHIATLSSPDSSAANNGADSINCTGKSNNLIKNGLYLGGARGGLGLPDYVTRYVPRKITY